MTRSELIEAMARAGHEAKEWDGGLSAFDEMPQDYREKTLTIISATLSAIEQAGFVVVPVQPLPEMTAAWYRYKNGHRFADEEPARDTSDYGAYAAMLEAGRLK